jgi:hypothetical protein
MDYLQDDKAVSVRHWCSRHRSGTDKRLVITPILSSREKSWRERVLPRRKAQHDGLGRAVLRNLESSC